MNLEDINNLKHLISPDRVKNINNFLFSKDKKLSLGSELLLRFILRKIHITDPIFYKNSYGKLFLKNYPNIHFNISHSEDYVVCGVSTDNLGVDIELISAVDCEIAKNYFHKIEYEYLKKSNDFNNSFYKLWVLKESYVKMLGLGLKKDLNSFYITFDGVNKEFNIFDESNHLDEYCRLPKFKVWKISNKKDNKIDNSYYLSLCYIEKADNIELIEIKNIDEILQH
ncbi:MAG: 4'-phosphopantetheinyl transferase superfamily protein [Methanobrevibacter sp.]|nr:4'-phosphopantetheinyl transferase superfamily protein [Methanobrevibacter sp.]